MYIVDYRGEQSMYKTRWQYDFNGIRLDGEGDTTAACTPQRVGTLQGIKYQRYSSEI